MPVNLTPSGYMKCTYTFDYESAAAGFSESWYIKSGTLSGALTIASDLIPQRLAICGADVSMRAIRVSDPVRPGRTRVQQMSPTQGKGDWVAVEPGSWPQDLALLLRVESADDAHSVRYLKGLPADLYKFPEFADTANTVFVAGLAALLSGMAANFAFGSKRGQAPGTLGLHVVDALVPLRVGKRASGRPFDVSHGRRVR